MRNVTLPPLLRQSYEMLRNLANRVLLVLPIVLAMSCSKGDLGGSRPNVIFLMLDTLRADHMSGYGYERPTTPVLDAFASENVKAEFAITAAPWTPASVASMFTGMYPSSHGMMPPNDRVLAKRGTARLDTRLHTLAERLKEVGYRTAGVSPNPWITKEFGYSQGFDEFYPIERQSAEKVTESGREIIEAWEKKGSDSPFFLYLHFLDPHEPYTPPPAYESRFTGGLTKSVFSYNNEMISLINLYDAEISYLDTELGKFFNYLKSKKLYEDLVIVIVSDHGEQFLEHGDLRHGYKLFNEEVHIPLLLKTGRVGDTGRVIKETVSTVDILPTILDRLRMEVPKELPGVSLLNDQAIKDRKGVLSEVRKDYDLKALTDNPGHRLVLDVPYDPKTSDMASSLKAWTAPRTVGVFDARSEYSCGKPMENKGLEARLRGFFDQARAFALKLFVAPSGKAEEVKDETLEQLKSLGYLQ